MKLWEKRPNKPPDELIGLLYKMAKDTFISKYRHQQTELAFVAQASNNNTSLSPEEEMNYTELKRAYEQALKQMPDTQREVFLMSRMEELKYHEIAERLTLSVKAVEKRMSKAILFLREALAAK